jgi:hypothetical protein
MGKEGIGKSVNDVTLSFNYVMIPMVSGRIFAL